MKDIRMQIVAVLVGLFAVNMRADHLEPGFHREVVSTCYVYEPFDPEIMVRLPGPDTDTVQYELNYFVREKVQILAFDAAGSKFYEKVLPKETPSFKLFSIDTRKGNEATLEKLVKQYIRSKKFHTCVD